MYKLCNVQNKSLNHDVSTTNEIWYRGLGHLNFCALPSIENLVIEVPKLKPKHDRISKGCALGKDSKGTFHYSEHKSKSVLELIHIDLCGPMTIPSLGGFLYYVIYVDDYSKKTWIYFLKLKE